MSQSSKVASLKKLITSSCRNTKYFDCKQKSSNWIAAMRQLILRGYQFLNTIPQQYHESKKAFEKFGHVNDLPKSGPPRKFNGRDTRIFIPKLLRDSIRNASQTAHCFQIAPITIRRALGTAQIAASAVCAILSQLAD